LLLGAAVFAVALSVLTVVRDRSLEGRLNSDEPEWIAASILHWNQLFRGAPPAGADLRPGAPGDSPWKVGFQRTTFGYMNPCLPKLVWGGVLAAGGHTRASAFAFQSFQQHAPDGGRAARDELLPAAPLARTVVLALAALSGALLFLVARASLGGRAGVVLGAAALGLWLASPLVRETANYVRTDHFMLPFCLGLWLYAATRTATFAGLRGAPALLRACAVAGLLSGLAVSSKLNGALAPIAFGVWTLLVWRRHRRDGSPRVSAGVVCAGLGLAAVTAFAVFVVLNPLLWSGPFAGVADILGRWDKLMTYFQDEWAPRTGVEVARTWTASVALFARRTLERDEPLHALFGVPGVVVAVLGALALAAQAGGWGRYRDGSAEERDRALAAVCFCAVFVLGTASWLPLDWPRLYLPATPAIVVVEMALLGFAARLVRGRGETVAT